MATCVRILSVALLAVCGARQADAVRPGHTAIALDTAVQAEDKETCKALAVAFVAALPIPIPVLPGIVQLIGLGICCPKSVQDFFAQKARQAKVKMFGKKDGDELIAELDRAEDDDNSDDAKADVDESEDDSPEELAEEYVQNTGEGMVLSTDEVQDMYDSTDDAHKRDEYEREHPWVAYNTLMKLYRFHFLDDEQERDLCKLASNYTKMKVVHVATLRRDADLQAKKIHKQLAVGEEIVVLDRKIVDGRVRVRCDRGWASVISKNGKVLLEEVGPESRPCHDLIGEHLVKLKNEYDFLPAILPGESRKCEQLPAQLTDSTTAQTEEDEDLSVDPALEVDDPEFAGDLKRKLSQVQRFKRSVISKTKKFKRGFCTKLASRLTNIMDSIKKLVAKYKAGGVAHDEVERLKQKYCRDISSPEDADEPAEE
eukprot:gnl/TRDRNA2_/TRDRNA2_67993_c0_seq1.p1 gnl/TRDRNA2_/TRDRNA2_67993_c0~~gnl/TRDRNA2_/TRDRNA2_67993_c0_seq1.p1  ORF type:complete len:428 (+),score=105.21 gnl/TRDRNA2_/TRDRNA2_67993_c0_seq1:60-1343(+)